MEAVQSILSGLPNDALIHVVSYLSTRQAMKLSMLNSWFRRALSFSTLKDPIPLIKRCTWQSKRGGEGQQPRRSLWRPISSIPVPFSSRTHSVVLSCKWHGSKPGKLYIVAVPSLCNPIKEILKSVKNGTIVYESPPAPSTEESMTLSFSTSPDKTFYLWYHVDDVHSVLGDSLFINNLSIRALIYDDAEKWIGRIYEMLDKVGFLESRNKFSLDMLLNVATVPAKDRDHFREFLERNGFGMSETCTNALAEVATALQEQESLKVAHDAPLASAKVNFYELSDVPDGGGVMEILDPSDENVPAVYNFEDAAQGQANVNVNVDANIQPEIISESVALVDTPRNLWQGTLVHLRLMTAIHGENRQENQAIGVVGQVGQDNVEDDVPAALFYFSGWGYLDESSVQFFSPTELFIVQEGSNEDRVAQEWPGFAQRVELL